MSITESINQSEALDNENKSFWDTLCGTLLAQDLGITDDSVESLKKYDDFYFSYYPYLKDYLFSEDLSQMKVLEVGLGYGTVGQALAAAGADYVGIDIASGPVHMLKHRFNQLQLNGDVKVESILKNSLADNAFDFVTAIGSFHHTGDFERCIDETYRVLKPGGKALIMVYNKFSLRHWVKWPKHTTKALIKQLSPFSRGKNTGTNEQRVAYDASPDGDAAPHTDFFSKTDIKKIFRDFKQLKITRENVDEQFSFKPLGLFSEINLGDRLGVLNTKWTRFGGLDLYIEVHKPLQSY